VNGDFIPQELELGPRSNVNFGNSVVTRRYAQDALDNRGYNWETSAALQHELFARTSVNVGYFRRWYGNQRVTDNLLLGAADYDPYCITAPRDSRLPDGGGYQVCGLFDVKPAKFGQLDQSITLSENFGEQKEIYNGVDVTLNARLQNGIVVSGGTSTGRVLTDNCYIVDSPQEMLNCEVAPPFQTQVKLLGVVPLPWDLQAAATFQSLPGPEITASYTATVAEILPSLGRVTASRGPISGIPLVAPGTMYTDRLNQVDVRMSRIFTIGRNRLQANFDIFNALNASSVLAQNNTFGTSWLRPTRILQGRIVKFGGQIDF
jgi:hypothetical protein